MLIFLIYLYLVLFIIFDIVILALGFEQIIAFISGIAPKVPSGYKLRLAVIAQISKDIPNVKTIIDIGSGWGTMVRSVARAFPNAKVYGVEIMPTTYLYSVVRCMFIRNAKLRMGNVFKFFAKKNQKFDVGITYLLPSEMQDVKKITDRFKILYVLDFSLPDVVPTKKIKLHKDHLGQHYLYVYKL